MGRFVLKKEIIKRESRYSSLYLMIGLMAMAVDLGLYFILWSFLGFAPIVATAISVGVAIVFGFILNQRYNFQVNDNIWKRFLSYASINSVGMTMSIFFIYFFVNILGFDAGLVRVVSVILIAGAQYLLNRLVSFNVNTFKK